VAQRLVETLIGRLITDEQFRGEFLADPVRTLIGLRDRGLELSAIEIAALVGTDPGVWVRTAHAIDPRLQKARLTSDAQ
jgi:hypothetical protein